MPPKIRYARVGEDQIAYQVMGREAPDLVWVHGTIAHLEWQWGHPAQAQCYEDVAAFCRLILFDRRGGGMSDRLGRVLTPDERVDDIRAVMDAAGSESAFIFGSSEGATLAMLYASLRPERTRGLILWGGKPRWVRAPDYPYGAPEEGVEERIQRVLSEPRPDIDPADPGWRRWLGRSADDPTIVAWLNVLSRVSLSPSDLARVTRMNALIDVRPLLASIRAPTLILAREDDPVAPLPLMEDVAQKIPNARLVRYPGQGHVMFDVWPEIATEIRAFVTGERVASTTERELATLVFTDLAGSTDVAARVGDAAWRSVLERYYALARKHVAAYSGVEIDTAGDGMFQRFDGPAKAVWFAKALRRDAADLGLTVRAAIHIGEVERSGPHLRGLAVVIGSRLVARAHGAEILVSGTIRDLLYGAGIAFDDRGVADLKGIPEPQRIYALM